MNNWYLLFLIIGFPETGQDIRSLLPQEIFWVLWGHIMYSNHLNSWIFLKPALCSVLFLVHNGQFLNIFYLRLCFSHSKLGNLMSHRRCQCALVCWVSFAVQFCTNLLPARLQAASASVTHSPDDLEWQRILRDAWYHHGFWTLVIITEFLC